MTPHAETVLRTLAALGIKRFRLGFFTYPPDGPPAKASRLDIVTG